ncbi:MAG: TA system VapC family ribonuclease toxin, partial [Myxococcota bacterium]
ELLARLANGTQPFGLVWPGRYEFLRVVTHRRVFDPPTSLADAIRTVEDFVAMPMARLLSETERHAQVLAKVLSRSPVDGNLVHDAHLVALALEHGVHEIVTYDRDFARFDAVRACTPEELA